MQPQLSPPAAVEQVIAKVRAVYARWSRTTPIEQMRADWDAFLAPVESTARVEGVLACGVDASWIRAEAAREERTLLYFHGGGYKMGSARSHEELLTRISSLARCRVLAPNYRLMPEHHFPAPLEDALAVYRWLLDQGIAASSIALAGDSAGGGLVAALLIELKRAGLPLPNCGVMLSALTDFAVTGASYESRKAVDPIHQRVLIQMLARQYLGEESDLRDPRASPLYGDLHGLPPLLLQVGDRETGLDDSVMFEERARLAGVPTKLQVWAGMIHVFQQFPDELIEARQALEYIGEFLDQHWSATS